MLTLRECLTLPDDYNWGGREDTADGPLYFHSHGSKVLGVAHLDTVLNAKPVRSGDYVFAPQLDDRLGVWCLLSALPRIGVQLDILLTTGEETGHTTGRYFSGNYNWVVELDRQGTDVVFYQYTYRKWCKAWRQFIRNGSGSYSDIASMELGVCCANVGIGYHNQHSRSCYVDLADTRKQLEQFSRFYNSNKDCCFPYQERIAKPKEHNWYHYSEPLPIYDKFRAWRDSEGNWVDQEGYFDAWDKQLEELT